MNTTPPKNASDIETEREAYYASARQMLAKRYKTFDTLSMELLYNLLQAFNSCAANLASRLVEHSMTLAGLNILGILLAHGKEGCPLNVLSGLLLVSRANITGLVDNLVRKGFVRREDHAQDRRIVLAKITPEGEAWLDRYLPGHYARINELLSGLSITEKRTLLKLLGKLRQSSCMHPASCGFKSEDEPGTAR